MSDRYQTLVLLGESAYARTLLARRLEDGLHVVVKVPVERLLAHSSFAYRFEHEAAELMRVEHPNITQVLDAGRESGVPFVVTEYVTGQSLAQRLGFGATPQSPTQIFAWLRVIAEALDFIHARQLVHGEVRPSQILFGPERQACLTDFVFAAALEGLDPKSRMELTAVHPAFDAPELATTRLPTPASDQYSLAAVACLSLVGKPPGAEPSRLEGALRKRVSSEDAGDLLRALSSDPEDRFPSCREFAIALGTDRTPRPDSEDAAVPAVEPEQETAAEREHGAAAERDPAAAEPAVSADAEQQEGVKDERREAADPESRTVASIDTDEDLRPAPPELEPPPRCWRIRLGEGDEYARAGRDHGFVGLTWDEIGDLRAILGLELASSFTELTRLYVRSYGVPRGVARRNAARIRRFVMEMEPGDVVLVPNPAEGLLHVGLIVGDPTFPYRPTEECPLRCRRDVIWSPDVRLADMPRPMLGSLVGGSAVQSVDAYYPHVRARIAPDDGGKRDAALLTGTVEALYALPPEEFQAFLQDLFAALGFDARVDPGPVDQTWEAAGTLEARGLARPALRAFVTRVRGSVDGDLVRQVRASLSTREYGVLISLGGILREARAEAGPPDDRRVRLIDGRTLASMAMDAWDDLSDAARDALAVERFERTTIEVEFRATSSP